MVRVVNIKDDDFFTLQRKVSEKCDKEFSGDAVLCKVSASDVEHRLLQRAGFFPIMGTISRGLSESFSADPTLQLGILPVNRPDRVVLEADEVERSAKVTRNDCDAWYRGIGTSSPEDVKKTAEKNTRQCERGAELVLDELAPFVKDINLG